MKLKIILNEAMSRRDFLRKSIGGGSAAITGKWDKVLNISGPDSLIKCKKLYENLSDAQKEALNNSIFNLANGFRGSIVRNGIIYNTIYSNATIDPKYVTEVAPIEAIYGQLASAIDEWGDNAPALILSGGSPTILHDISPTYFNSLIEQLINKFGMDKFIKLLSHGSYDIAGAESLFGAWHAALQVKALQNYTGVTPDMIYKAAEDGLYLRNLVDGGILSKEQAIEWKETLEYHKNQQQTQQAEKERSKKEAEEKERREAAKQEEKAKEQEEKASRSQDNKIYGSAMHQPFESKLNKILSMIK